MNKVFAIRGVYFEWLFSSVRGVVGPLQTLQAVETEIP